MDYLFHRLTEDEIDFYGIPNLFCFPNIIWSNILVNERKNSRGKIEIVAEIIYHCQEGF